jgi:hypothetical protein
LFILIVGEIGAKELHAFFIRVFVFLKHEQVVVSKKYLSKTWTRGGGLIGGENGRE